MMAQSEALGILYLTQPADARLTEAKQRLAVAMAEHIAMALSNLKLHETLRSQSIRDPLTGLFNRRFMEESLELELRRATRNRRPLGVIMLEVDSVPVRDPVDRRRRRGLDSARNRGAAADHHPQGRHRLPLRRRKVHHRPAPGKPRDHRPENGKPARHDQGPRDPAPWAGFWAMSPISAGIAVFPEQGRTVEALIRVADAALQRAKQEGGDRVVVAQ